jgi:hypothetical protein
VVATGAVKLAGGDEMGRVECLFSIGEPSQEGLTAGEPSGDCESHHNERRPITADRSFFLGWSGWQRDYQGEGR